MDEPTDLEEYKLYMDNPEQLEDESDRRRITKQNNTPGFYSRQLDEHLAERRNQYGNVAHNIFNELEANRNGLLEQPLTRQAILEKEKKRTSLIKAAQKIKDEQTRRFDRQVQIDNNNNLEINRVPYRGLVTRIEEIGNATNQIIKNNIAL